LDSFRAAYFGGVASDHSTAGRKGEAMAKPKAVEAEDKDLPLRDDIGSAAIATATRL